MLQTLYPEIHSIALWHMFLCTCLHEPWPWTWIIVASLYNQITCYITIQYIHELYVYFLRNCVTCTKACCNCRGLHYYYSGYSVWCKYIPGRWTLNLFFAILSGRLAMVLSKSSSWGLLLFRFWEGEGERERERGRENQSIWKYLHNPTYAHTCNMYTQIFSRLTPDWNCNHFSVNEHFFFFFGCILSKAYSEIHKKLWQKLVHYPECMYKQPTKLYLHVYTVINLHYNSSQILKIGQSQRFFSKTWKTQLTKTFGLKKTL